MLTKQLPCGTPERRGPKQKLAASADAIFISIPICIHMHIPSIKSSMGPMARIITTVWPQDGHASPKPKEVQLRELGARIYRNQQEQERQPGNLELGRGKISKSKRGDQGQHMCPHKLAKGIGTAAPSTLARLGKKTQAFSEACWANYVTLVATEQ